MRKKLQMNLKKQEDLLSETLKIDIVICTALIPGKSTY